MLTRSAKVFMCICILWSGYTIAHAGAQEKEGKEAKPTQQAQMFKTIRKSLLRGYVATIIEVIPSEGRVVLQRDAEKLTAQITTEGKRPTQLMKDGKRVTLKDFKANEAVVFAFKPRSRRYLRFLADPLSYIAFIRRSVLKVEVVALDKTKRQITIKTADGKEHIVPLSRQCLYFLNGRRVKFADVQLKPGTKLWVAFTTTAKVHALFDDKTWKSYALLKWERFQARQQRKGRKQSEKKESGKK